MNLYGVIVNMFVCPNLITGLRLWIMIFVRGPTDLGFLNGEYSSLMYTLKTTLYVPLVTLSEMELASRRKEFEVLSFLRTITLVAFDTYSTSSLEDYPSNMTLEWTHSCGRNTVLIRVPLKWNGRTYSTDIDRKILKLAIFRTTVHVVGDHRVIHFSFTMPVTDNLIGIHMFALKTADGQIFRKTQEILLKTKVQKNTFKLF